MSSSTGYVSRFTSKGPPAFVPTKQGEGYKRKALSDITNNRPSFRSNREELTTETMHFPEDPVPFKGYDFSADPEPSIDFFDDLEKGRELPPIFW